MKLVLTRNDNLIGSFLIRWGTSDSFFSLAPVSHFIIVFDDKLVFESTLSRGLHVTTLSEAHDPIISFEFVPPLSSKVKGLIYEKALELSGNSYDLSSMLYISWRMFLKKFFNKEIPKKNSTEINDQYFCVEVIEIINGAFKALGLQCPIEDTEYSMVSPWELAKLLRNSGMLKECQNTL